MFQPLQLHSLIRFFNILGSFLDFCPTLMKKMYFLIHHYMSKQASAKNCAFKIPKNKKTGCTEGSCRDSPMWLWGFNEQHSKNVNIGSIFQALKRVHQEQLLRFQMFCRMLQSITDTSTEDTKRRNCLWRFLRARAFIAGTAGRRYQEGGARLRWTTFKLKGERWGWWNKRADFLYLMKATEGNSYSWWKCKKTNPE